MKRKLVAAMLVALCVAASGCMNSVNSPVIQEIEASEAGNRAGGEKASQMGQAGESRAETETAQVPEVEPEAIGELKEGDSVEIYWEESGAKRS